MELSREASGKFIDSFIDVANIIRHGKCYECELYTTHTVKCQSGAALVQRLVKDKKRAPVA